MKFFKDKPKSISQKYIELIKGQIGKFNKLKPITKKLIISFLVLVLTVIGFAIFWRFWSSTNQPKQIYEVAVMVRDQFNSNPSEDARTSLKAGDVIVKQKEGHSWSTTEKTSYLILKINLTTDQADKLTRPEERELKKNELSTEEIKRMDDVKKKGEKMPPRMITLRARQYRIKLEEFTGFDPLQLLNGQPYLDKIYDWGIVEKK